MLSEGTDKRLKTCDAPFHFFEIPPSQALTFASVNPNLRICIYLNKINNQSFPNVQ